MKRKIIGTILILSTICCLTLMSESSFAAKDNKLSANKTLEKGRYLLEVNGNLPIVLPDGVKVTLLKTLDDIDSNSNIGHAPPSTCRGAISGEISDDGLLTFHCSDCPKRWTTQLKSK